MSWEELVERSMPTKDEYGDFMSWMYEEMKKVNGGVFSIEDFEETIKGPGFDLDGYIISKNITNEQEKELAVRLGTNWKFHLKLKWSKFKIAGGWNEEWEEWINKQDKMKADIQQ